MRYFLHNGPLRDKAGEGDDGGQSAVAPGAPYVHGSAPAKEAAQPVQKTAAEVELEDTRKQLESARRERDEAKQSEKYWSDRARSQRVEVPETDDEPEPEDAGRPQVRRDKPEKLLDEMTEEGIEALRKRGIVTQEDLDAALAKQAKKNDARLALSQRQNAFDQQFNREFPDIAADGLRIQRGEQPKTEAFKRAQQHFKDMIADDPSLRDSPAALRAAAKMATKELEMEAKHAKESARDRQESRRDRIDGQRGERPGAGHSESDDEENQLSPLAQQISRGLGLSDAEAQKAYATAGRNGRGR